jgi:hypothetical protein
MAKHCNLHVIEIVHTHFQQNFTWQGNPATCEITEMRCWNHHHASSQGVRSASFQKVHTHDATAYESVIPEIALAVNAGAYASRPKFVSHFFTSSTLHDDASGKTNTINTIGIKHMNIRTLHLQASAGAGSWQGDGVRAQALQA